MAVQICAVPSGNTERKSPTGRAACRIGSFGGRESTGTEFIGADCCGTRRACSEHNKSRKGNSSNEFQNDTSHMMPRALAIFFDIRSANSNGSAGLG
ncbi:hypothetical protein ACVWZR_002231 [Bradyrhizobium sp. i1.3.1]